LEWGTPLTSVQVSRISLSLDSSSVLPILTSGVPAASQA